jgi:hypothetical protein
MYRISMQALSRKYHAHRVSRWLLWYHIKNAKTLSYGCPTVKIKKTPGHPDPSSGST